MLHDYTVQGTDWYSVAGPDASFLVLCSGVMNHMEFTHLSGIHLPLIRYGVGDESPVKSVASFDNQGSQYRF